MLMLYTQPLVHGEFVYSVSIENDETPTYYHLQSFVSYTILIIFAQLSSHSLCALNLFIPFMNFEGINGCERFDVMFQWNTILLH